MVAIDGDPAGLMTILFLSAPPKSTAFQNVTMLSIGDALGQRQWAVGREVGWSLDSIDRDDREGENMTTRSARRPR